MAIRGELLPALGRVESRECGVDPHEEREIADLLREIAELEASRSRLEVLRAQGTPVIPSQSSRTSRGQAATGALGRIASRPHRA